MKDKSCFGHALKYRIDMIISGEVVHPADFDKYCRVVAEMNARQYEERFPDDEWSIRKLLD